MGAVALTKEDEGVLDSLRELLRLPSKSQVIHRALNELRALVMREQLACEIRQSVQKCRVADLKENQGLAGSSFHYSEKE